jgi:hypothetical protein
LPRPLETLSLVDALGLQAIPLVTALSVCGGLTIVVALVASGVVLVRRTVSKRVEMRLAASQ